MCNIKLKGILGCKQIFDFELRIYVGNGIISYTFLQQATYISRIAHRNIIQGERETNIERLEANIDGRFSNICKRFVTFG